jgi:small subunit ribosomal protein S2
MSIKLSVDEMTKAGLQFGHKKSKIHPKMKPYLYGVRNTVFIIDLNKTVDRFEAALEAIGKMVADDKTIIMVGTKVQFKKMVKEVAVACGFPFVTERWLGGTFTNFGIIKKRLDYFKDQAKKMAAGEFEKYTKKEQANINKELKDLERKFGGIKNLDKMPQAVFVVDMKKDKLAVKEARENGVKVIGIADVNIDPDTADYPIIANDDAISSVGYILDKVKEVVLAQRQVNLESKPAQPEATK